VEVLEAIGDADPSALEGRAFRLIVLIGEAQTAARYEIRSGN
jgi:hypothetical protein